MSADNYILVHRTGKKWSVYLQCSASMSDDENIETSRDHGRGPDRVFDQHDSPALNYADAIAWASAQEREGYYEYGLHVVDHPSGTVPCPLCSRPVEIVDLPASGNIQLADHFIPVPAPQSPAPMLEAWTDKTVRCPMAGAEVRWREDVDG